MSNKINNRQLQIHTAGMMTDLPHHLSTEQEFLNLLFAIKHLLKKLLDQAAVGLPAMITIARYDQLALPKNSLAELCQCQQDITVCWHDVYHRQTDKISSLKFSVGLTSILQFLHEIFLLL